MMAGKTYIPAASSPHTGSISQQYGFQTSHVATVRVWGPARHALATDKTRKSSEKSVSQAMILQMPDSKNLAKVSII